MNLILNSVVAAAALAFATPAQPWTACPDIEFGWLANVGGSMLAAEAYPATRIVDDLDGERPAYASKASKEHGDNGPFELRDRDGNVIAFDFSAFPLDFLRR